MLTHRTRVQPKINAAKEARAKPRPKATTSKRSAAEMEGDSADAPKKKDRPAVAALRKEADKDGAAVLIADDDADGTVAMQVQKAQWWLVDGAPLSVAEQHSRGWYKPYTGKGHSSLPATHWSV